MAWTQADIDATEAALRARQGAKSVQFSDQVVQFESLEDMRKLLEEQRREVAGAAGAPASLTRYAAFRKGC